ncbi:uncharacterized protein LOC127878629 [Dreissena polymorpha]|uniref:uncharacterized protein LOC127878629 n=1 Tax=Dreissena polymorpha TaxID=45954 RepID=UPI0022654AF6|nr:uncharacterized protein LOC127878629 [Dreissena polymorpha]
MRQTGPTGSGGTGRAGLLHGRPKQGCYHNRLLYQPMDDVIVGTIGDRCYGYYCEGDNIFVHWEDVCVAPSATASASAADTSSARSSVSSEGDRRITGCLHQGNHYNPSEDVILGHIGDICYGYYCEADNVFVHWEERCKHGHSPWHRNAPGGVANRGVARQGCHHRNMYYQPGEEVIAGTIGEFCYGYYCEAGNLFVHWEERCSDANGIK